MSPNIHERGVNIYASFFVFYSGGHLHVRRKILRLYICGILLICIVANKFRDKYRVHTPRAAWWDYSRDGIYFITICTQGREHLFGEVVNDVMELSPIGEIAQTCWHEIPEHFPYVHLDAFVVMPNHVHGILVVDKTSFNSQKTDTHNVETQNLVSPTEMAMSLNQERKSHKNAFGPQSGNLASVIRGYKVGVTKNARHIHADFAWQPRYHEHIIRNLESYEKIFAYIQNNPMNWEKDKFYGNSL